MPATVYGRISAIVRKESHVKMKTPRNKSIGHADQILRSPFQGLTVTSIHGSNAFLDNRFVPTQLGILSIRPRQQAAMKIDKRHVVVSS